MTNTTGQNDQLVATTAVVAQEQGAAPNFAFNDEPVFTLNDDTLGFPKAHTSVAMTSVGSADDFFSSPEWTDPSPALTTSMSFAMDSCDTSPLLADNYEAPEFSGMSLFSDQANYSLFGSSSTSDAETRPKRSPQNAFNQGKASEDENPTIQLLRALNGNGMGAALNNVDLAKAASAAAAALAASDKSSLVSQPATASPAVLSSPAPLSALPLPEHSPSITCEVERLAPHGVKRRLDSTDLLPMDAPIQPRKYKSPSATSRKDSKSSSSEDLPSTPVDPNMDPVAAKRLSNTLAARRSRHRKAEELRALQDQISDLTSEVEMWKRRCLEAEKQRDEVYANRSD